MQYFPHYVNKEPRPHRVDVVLLSLTVGGRGRHIMDEEEYWEAPGSLGITHYGQMHDIVTEDEGIAIFNVYIDLRNHPLPVLPKALRDVLAGILPLHPHLCHRRNRHVHLRLEDEREAVHLLKRILYEQSLNDGASDEVIRTLLGLFLVELCRAALRHGFVMPSGPKENSIAWLERLRQDLDARYREPLTLPDLARNTGIHPSYLCRAFKRYTGTTLMEYLNMRRVQAAMIHIRSTHDKIVHIALESGFNDLAYFNRKFKAITGFTPTQYRGAEAGDTASARAAFPRSASN